MNNYLLLMVLIIVASVSCKERIDQRQDDANSQNSSESLETTENGDKDDTNQIPTNQLTHFEAPCNQCHENDRPETNHVQNGDCVNCHSFPDWNLVSTANFSHLPKPDQCESCHLRPESGLRSYPNQGPPANSVEDDDGFKHYAGKDCISCHLTPDEGEQSFVFNHSQPQANFCLPCHFNEGQEEHINEDFAQLSGFGNCYECHTSFDVQNNRSFEEE